MDRINVGRLALRTEGDFWCAYVAEMGTMVGAILLGSIRMSTVASGKNGQLRKTQFMALMQEAYADKIEEITGSRPSMNAVVQAPTHEKSSNA